MGKYTDLLKHLAAFGVLAGLTAAGVAILGWPQWLQAPMAVLTTLVVGIWWELYEQRTGMSQADPTDVMADLAAGFVVAMGLTWGTAAAAWYGALCVLMLAGAYLTRAAREAEASAEISGAGGPGPIEPPPKK